MNTVTTVAAFTGVVLSVTALSMPYILKWRMNRKWRKLREESDRWHQHACPVNRVEDEAWM